MNFLLKNFVSFIGQVKKNMINRERVIWFVKWFFDQLFVAITHKNPCKKCLVRPCCSDRCEAVIVFENFYWSYKESFFKRVLAWSIISSTPTIVWGVVTMIVKP